MEIRRAGYSAPNTVLTARERIWLTPVPTARDAPRAPPSAAAMKPTTREKTKPMMNSTTNIPAQRHQYPRVRRQLMPMDSAGPASSRISTMEAKNTRPKTKKNTKKRMMEPRPTAALPAAASSAIAMPTATNATKNNRNCSNNRGSRRSADDSAAPSDKTAPLATAAMRRTKPV